MILDATCSSLKLWPREASVRMDVRREVNPNLVGDARFLPFRPSSLDVIFCDPPHIIGGKTNWMSETPAFGKAFASFNRANKKYAHWNFVHSYQRFGFWVNRDEWLSFVRSTNEEFLICLRPGGQLKYKISELKDKKQSVLIDDVKMGYSNFTITKENVTYSQRFHNPVHWLTMKPRGDPLR